MDKNLIPFLESLESIWKLVVKLECSAEPIHRQLVSKLPIIQWVTFREPLLLLERQGWRVRPGDIVHAYVGAMFEGNQHTLALENTFNDLRDNEGRGARHKVRTEQVLQGLALSSMQTRYGDHCPIVSVEPEDIAGQAMGHVRPDTFVAGKAPTTPAAVGFESSSLINDRKSWPSTTPNDFSNVQLGLLHALTFTDEDKWDNLWMSNLLRRHMVVRKQESGVLYYVVSARATTISLLELQPTDDELLWVLKPTREALKCWVTVTSLDEYRCHGHTLELHYESRG